MDACDRRAQAVAVRGGRFNTIGADAEVTALAGPRTELIDLDGATVLPGLIDTHAHFHRIGARAPTTASLYGCTSVEELVARLLAHREILPDGAPILGLGDCFRAAHFAEKRQVCAADLDRVARDRAVVISDVHKTILNSHALKNCAPRSVPSSGPDVPLDLRGDIVPGLFFSDARNVLQLPHPVPDVSLPESLRRSAAEFSRHGLTTVVDAGPPLDVIESYVGFTAEDALGVRVVVLPAVRDVLEPSARERIPFFGAAGPCYRMGPAKQFYDRFVMHRTALMYEPYPGMPDNVGKTFVPLEELRGCVEHAWGAGWPLGIHVTGDRGAVEAAHVLRGVCHSPRPGRNHLIHAYFPTPKLLSILREADLGVALQPSFLRAWGATLKEFVGCERAARFLPLRTYLDAGITVGGGSDAPIVHWSPFRAMATAIDREALDGDVLGEEEAISTREALALYTSGAAQVLGLESEIGTVEPGKAADLTIVDGDVFIQSPSDLAETRVTATMLQGRLQRH